MRKTITCTMFILVSFLISVSASFAQEPSPSPAQNQSETSAERSLKSRVFEIKYRDPNSLKDALYFLGSGAKGSSMSANTEFRTITVRDYPEILATIEEAIKRLDVPATPRPNIELHMHVLIASNSGGAAMDVPAEMKDVLTQLRGTLNYQKYELAASIVQRLTETPRGLQGAGVADFPSSTPGAPSSAVPYEYAINNVSLVQNVTGPPSVQINEFAFAIIDKDRARVQTALNLRDGEKVVVGTATLKDRALVIVLTAKLIK